jgi:hypothetical protein
MLVLLGLFIACYNRKNGDVTQGFAGTKREAKQAQFFSSGGNRYANVGNWNVRLMEDDKQKAKQLQAYWNVFDPSGGVTNTAMQFKKQKNTTTSSSTADAQIASKINVTNRNLEIINRNLVALRSDVRTYMLPGSAYFSTKRSLDDEFALDSMRG